MRIVAWNIRAGGGRRVAAIARQLRRWAPDVVALSEFRATPPSIALAAALAEAGLGYQLTTADPRRPTLNALLLAARWPLRRVRLGRAPAERIRWLSAAVAAPLPVVVGALHAPNYVSGRKYPFLDAVLACAQGWRRGPALFVGDTNSGRRGLDEETPVFRHLQPEARAYTWYSPNGRNGFRIDQAFVNAALLAHLKEAVYTWGGTARRRRDALSDHAALLVDLAG